MLFREKCEVGFFDVDLKPELAQLEAAVNGIVDDKLTPLVDGAIRQAGAELGAVVNQASTQLQQNIQVLSREIHSQRRMTGDEITRLIDYAAEKIGECIDQRVGQIRRETSELLEEKICVLKSELDEAAVRSRKTLYSNLAVSIGAAVGMAVVGLIYKKVSLGQLDVFALFRVLLLAAAVGTGAFSLLKMLGQWRGMNREKKNLSVVLVSYLGVVRPNGAAGYFLLSVILLAGWVAVSFLRDKKLMLGPRMLEFCQSLLFSLFLVCPRCRG